MITYEISKRDDTSLYKLVKVEEQNRFEEMTTIGYYNDYLGALNAMKRVINPPQPKVWVFDAKGEIIG